MAVGARPNRPATRVRVVERIMICNMERNRCWIYTCRLMDPRSNQHGRVPFGVRLVNWAVCDLKLSYFKSTHLVGGRSQEFGSGDNCSASRPGSNLQYEDVELKVSEIIATDWLQRNNNDFDTDQLWAAWFDLRTNQNSSKTSIIEVITTWTLISELRCQRLIHNIYGVRS